MKAEELMIGDFVRIKDFYGYKRVIEIRSSGAFMQDRIGNDLLLDFSELEPIPIDENILKRTGFEINKPYAYLKVEDGKYLQYYFHEHRLIEWCESIDEWENHSRVKTALFKCNPVYVHELQHAFKLCGVDKKIEFY